MNKPTPGKWAIGAGGSFYHDPTRVIVAGGAMPYLVADLRKATMPEKEAEANAGSKNAKWKGGKRKRGHGYIGRYRPNHPHAYQCSVLEHRLVMEDHLGRVLLPSEIVHHINGLKDDNRIENLMLFSSNSAHAKYHRIVKSK